MFFKVLISSPFIVDLFKNICYEAIQACNNEDYERNVEKGPSGLRTVIKEVFNPQDRESCE